MRTRWSRSTFVRLALACLPVAVASACSLDGSTTSSDDVTSVENTGVKSQAIANCWLYATAGWAESLHKGATSRDVDLSEAYWNYWYWYEQISGGNIVLTNEFSPDGVGNGGWWGLGAALIQRYGWMHEGDFIPDADANAKRHEEASAAILDSLRSGALHSWEARRDPGIVRAELNKAWKVGPSVVEDLERQFPILPARVPVTTDAGAAPAQDGGPRPTKPLPDPPVQLVAITERAAGGRSLGLTRIHAPQELPAIGADGVTIVSLADIVGVQSPGTDVGDGIRMGDESWSEIRYTWSAGDLARRRAFLKNVQNTLNRRLAVPIGWAVTPSVADGVYRAGGTEYDVTGLHESILVNYEVDAVPGFGKLQVDVRETRPEALEATLDDAANITFFRIKNSWGVESGLTAEELRQNGGGDAGARSGAKASYLAQKPGYNDLLVAFLDQPSTRFGNSPGGHFALRFALPSKLRFAIPEPAAAQPVDAGSADTGTSSDAGAGKK